MEKGHETLMIGKQKFLKEAEEFLKEVENQRIDKLCWVTNSKNIKPK